jgi:hypothetical protein
MLRKVFNMAMLTNSRLTGQHNFMVWRNGWLLHPTLKEKLMAQAEQRIADVGTGNG